MSADVEAVEAVHEEFYAALEAGDLDRMGEVWAEGDVTCVHPGWPLLRGRDQVLRSWALIMANTAYIQFVLTEVATRVAGDQAVVSCAENILTADGATGFSPGGKIVTTNVFVRTDAGWRLWLHHGSPVLDRDEDEVEE
jgi:uncharacterized protein (TIGR02246 family)